jgi:Phospholipase_D-nuclease N-terminal/Short C-terminal domain
VLATFTFGDALLSVLELALLFLWIWIAVGVVFDIFRSRDLSNAAKALWMLFIILIPYIGVLAYLLVRGHTMHEHHEQDRSQYEDYKDFRESPRRGGTAEDIVKLADLRERGILTDEEFERAKAKALA